MEMEEYQNLAHVTEAPITDEVKRRLDEKGLRILHGAIGVVTEAGELFDSIKKTLYYGKDYDNINAAEEIGDIMWYIALLCNALNVSLESVCTTNIAKLRKRYGDKFSEHDALNRDLDAERRILEG